MSEAAPHRMTVDEFLVWAKGRPERHELVDGRIYVMAPERAGHARAKIRVHGALERVIARASLPCEAMPDGMTVRIDAATGYEPDASVYCGPRIAEGAKEVPDPVIVIEVLSPSTGRYDRHDKLVGYFGVASLRHYLIVDIDRRVVIHHVRDDEMIKTRILQSGPLHLDAPGLDLTVEELLDPISVASAEGTPPARHD